jgi:hypothetical protein
MRVYSTFALLCAAALLVATAGPGGAGDPPAPSPLRLSGQIVCGVVRGDHFCAVASNGGLIDVDLHQRQVKELGSPGAKLVPCLDVAAGKALVASDDHIYLLEMPGGKTLRSLEFHGGVCGLGFLGDERIFVVTGCSVEVLEPGSGKVLHSIATGDKQKPIDRERVKHCRVGRRLYVGGGDGSLLVIDLAEGKLSERIAPGTDRPWDGIGNIQVVGDKAFVEQMFLGYGIWQKSVALLDLTTKKYVRLRLRGSEWVSRAARVVAGPGGTALLVGHDNQIWQSDAAGQLGGSVPAPAAGTLLGVWHGQAILAKGETLQIAALAEPDKTAAAQPADDPWCGTYLKFAEFDFLRTEGSAPRIAITRDGDGYRLSKPYDAYKFIEVEKGVLQDSQKIFGSIYLGSAQFVAGSKKPATVLRVEFCYEHFHLWR